MVCIICVYHVGHMVSVHLRLDHSDDSLMQLISEVVVVVIMKIVIVVIIIVIIVVVIVVVAVIVNDNRRGVGHPATRRTIGTAAQQTSRKAPY